MSPEAEPGILLVDDEPDFLDAIEGHLREAGYRVLSVDSPARALQALERATYQLAVLDVRMPGGSGIDLLQQIRERWPRLQAVVLTGYSSIEDAVRAVRLGALDYLKKPIALDELARLAGRAMEIVRLQQEALASRQALDRADAFAEIVGASSRLVSVLTEADRIAATDATVLIEGASGTGKELFAQAIHRASHRGHRPLVVLNASTLSELLIESELFGHMKGAFTGASESRAGLVAAADGGTLFIDEVGELSLACQARFLRVLECGEYRPVGATASLHADLRVLAATNRCLAEEVKRGRFREDLFFRLAVFRLQLPSLCDRREDIPLLVEHLSERCERPISLEPGAMELLQSHGWPGNVRELLHVLQRASLVKRGEPIAASDIVFSSARTASVAPDGSVVSPLHEVERQHITRVLHAAQGNMRQTARLLGVSLRNLYRKVERHAIDVEAIRDG